MPAIKRMVDVAIVVLALLDLVLTALFFSTGHHPPGASSPQQAVAAAPLQPSATKASALPDSGLGVLVPDSGPFLLLRGGPGAGDAHELFTCSAAGAQKWDYGGGTNTAQNWITWASTTPATSPTTSDALFMLLRAPDISGGQPYICPSADASKWDYGGRTNTARNWANWANASVPCGFRLSTSLANSAAGSDLPSPTP